MRPPSPTASSATVRALLEPWAGSFGGVPPFDAATPEAFGPALEAALAEERAEVAAIASSAEPPTFANTVEALQRAGRTKERVLRVFDVMRLNMSTPAYQALDREWQPRLAEADDALTFWPGLFERVDAVYQGLSASGLSEAQQRLATLVWKGFVRAGARLDDAGRAELSRLNQELARLHAEFRLRVMAAEDTWILLTDRAERDGLPEAVVSGAEAAARERGVRGWAILNTRSSVDPFLTFASRRDLREKVWRAFKQRGDGGPHNTNDLIVAIVRVRAEQARLLGYPSHAHLQMSDSVAGEPERARALLERVWRAASARVRDEVADMQQVADADGAGVRIAAWDYLYYAERVRQATLSCDQAALRPYFELERMLTAVAWCAEKLYGLSFVEISGQVPVFHPDVRVWDVRESNGNHRGLFYLDTFARAGKRSGAWQSTYRLQYQMDGGQTAIASVNNNFLKGTAGAATTLSIDDVRTLFHECGHALHALMQDVAYPGLAHTPRDFVELPSQLNEQWIFTREVLERFARHVQTDVPLPTELVEQVRLAEAFNQGYKTGEAVAAALVDLELHTRPDGKFDPPAFEREMLARIGMPPELALRHRLPHFDHLFGSDGYSGLYYSYLWADVMSADGWQAFVEAGTWSPERAAAFRTHILADGNTVDRAEAYRRFRGRDPEVDALLAERGLTVG